MRLASSSRYPSDLTDRHFGPVGTTFARYMLRGKLPAETLTRCTLLVRLARMIGVTFEGADPLPVADTYSDVLDTLTRDIGERWDPSGDMTEGDRSQLWLSADSLICVDTALSLEGPFDPHADDTWVDLASPDGMRVLVCVSPRYTAPTGPRNAARIALDAAIETMGGEASDWFVLGVSRVR